MPKLKLGPRAQEQLRRMARSYPQGTHVVVSGPTGSGKTTLARYIAQMRLNAGGHVVVLVTKPKDDPTILAEYEGWTRWKKWKRRPSSWENKVLLWPDLKKAKGNRRMILEMQRAVFDDMSEYMIDKGNYTVVVDESLYVCSNEFLNRSDDIAMLHSIGRSGNVSMIDLMQRPANVPLIEFGSAGHAFIGRAREQVDLKRLADMGSRESSREIAERVKNQGLHDFTWVPILSDKPAESFNMGT